MTKQTQEAHDKINKQGKAHVWNKETQNKDRAGSWHTYHHSQSKRSGIIVTCHLYLHSNCSELGGFPACPVWETAFQELYFRLCFPSVPDVSVYYCYNTLSDVSMYYCYQLICVIPRLCPVLVSLFNVYAHCRCHRYGKVKSAFCLDEPLSTFSVLMRPNATGCAWWHSWGWMLRCKWSNGPGWPRAGSPRGTWLMTQRKTACSHSLNTAERRSHQNLKGSWTRTIRPQSHPYRNMQTTVTPRLLTTQTRLMGYTTAELGKLDSWGTLLQNWAN